MTAATCPCADDSPAHRAFCLTFDIMWPVSGPKAHDFVRNVWHLACYRFPRLDRYAISDDEALGILWAGRRLGTGATVKLVLDWAERDSGKPLGVELLMTRCLPESVAERLLKPLDATLEESRRGLRQLGIDI